MTQIEIPSELPIILRDFTLSVLRKKPRDIVGHAVEYFTKLQQSQLITGDNMGTTVPPSFSSISQLETLKQNNILSGQSGLLDKTLGHLPKNIVQIEAVSRIDICY